jgi:hypothetical protein
VIPLRELDTMLDPIPKLHANAKLKC